MLFLISSSLVYVRILYRCDHLLIHRDAQRDTTAQGLSWIFFHLMSNPAVVETLRQDVDAVPVVDYDNFKSMDQVMAVFNEGLRVGPSLSATIRGTSADVSSCFAASSLWSVVVSVVHDSRH